MAARSTATGSSSRRRPGERDRAGAREEIRRSLERLGVDHVDLIQLHNLVDAIEWETALGAGGALEAAVEARDEGLVRFIGVTGHGLTVAQDAPPQPRALPVRLGAAAVQLRPDARRALRLRLRGARRRLRASAASRCRRSRAITLAPWDGREQTAATWYEPLREQDDIDLAVHWVLGRPGVFLNTVGDVALLPKVLDAASRYESRPSDETMDELAARRNLVPLFS